MPLWCGNRDLQLMPICVSSVISYHNIPLRCYVLTYAYLVWVGFS
jgi:hypothetical protein